MSPTRSCLFTAVAATGALALAGPAPAATPAARTAATGSGVTAIAAAPLLRCASHWRLRARGNGFVCKRGRRVHAPRCRPGLARKKVRGGWVCRRPAVKAPVAPRIAPPAPAPKRPAATPRPATPRPAATPTPTPAPPADPRAALINETAAYAEGLGREFNGQGDQTSRWYAWGVDRTQCSVVNGDTGRCFLWLWRERNVTDGNFRPGFQREIYRVSTFSQAVADGLYHSWTNQADYFDPLYYVCSDILTGVPRCT